MSEANATKQSISATCEFCANLLLYANLRLDSSIRSWVIDSPNFLKSRDLDSSRCRAQNDEVEQDCVILSEHSEAKYPKQVASSDRFMQYLNNKITHPLAPSAREGEQIDSISAREGEFFTSLTPPTKDSK